MGEVGERRRESERWKGQGVDRRKGSTAISVSVKTFKARFW